MSLLAIDIGSSSCKAVVFAVSGEILAQHSTAYAPHFPRPGFAEMNPEKFWEAVCECSQSVARNLADPVCALAFSSHGETFVAVDSAGQAVAPAILNQDSRAIGESTRLEEMIGRRRMFEITGLTAHPMYPIPKIIWLRQYQPATIAVTTRFLTLIGYLLGRMGLPAYVDYSLASRFLAFDVRRRCWSDEILNALEINKHYLPDPVPAGTVVGKLNSDIACQLGVHTGTVVVLGGHDQPCGALGVGVVSEGRVSDSIGTYECLVAASVAPTLNAKALAAALNSYCHVVPNKYVTLAFFPSGIMIKWFHDLLYSNVNGSHLESGSQELEAARYALLESHAPEGPTGLCITPHLIGTCNPDFNPQARGAITGLTPGTDRAAMYKGILEGLACELSIVAQTLADAVGPFEDVYTIGGGTRSPLGLRLRAALTGWRLHVMRQQEAVCLGTAILAGVAIGEYSSFDQAIATLVKEGDVVMPDQAIASSYRDQLGRYRQFRSAAIEHC